MQKLVGKKVLEVWLSKGEEDIFFLTDGEVIRFTVSGDCCSESWFSDIIGLSSLIGGTVQSVREDELPEYNVNDGRGRQQEDQAYGYTVETEKGACSIVFRNSSNGYYGGTMDDGTSVEKPEGRQIAKDYPQ